MPVIETAVDLRSDAARANREAWDALKSELARRRAEVAKGGPKRARERHLARGKLLPRERVLRLIDPGSPFLELSPLAALRHVRRRHPRRRADHRHRPRRRAASA